MQKLLHKLRTDFPELQFRAGEKSCWSPKDKTIIYKPQHLNEKMEIWSLLHEVGHAMLDHANYSTDFELLKMEGEAWQKAELLAEKYGHEIDNDHIQDCLDTYRNWLHCRSTCPTCTSKSLQLDARVYACFNCGTRWSVSTSLFCRPYRMLVASANHKSEYRNSKQIPIFN